MSDPITLPGTIPGLLCPGMLATGRVDAGSWVTGRIVAVDAPGERAKYPSAPRCSVGIADNYGMRPFRPEEVEIDLSDLLTLQPTVAWCVSKVSGRTVGPHECMARYLERYRFGTLEISLGHESIYIGGSGSYPSDGHFPCPGIFDHIPASHPHRLAIVVQAVALAIHEGRIKVGPNA